MPNVGEQMLFVVTARRVMPWSAFKTAFDYLYVAAGASGSLDLTEARRARLQAVSNLAALGHCDFDFASASARVLVGPTALARLPFAGAPEAVLCGGRTPGAVEQLAQAARKREPQCEVLVDHPEPLQPTAPSRVRVRSSRTAGIESLAHDLGLRFFEIPPAWQLANLAPSLEDVSRLLEWRPLAEPNWPAEAFDPRLCRFCRQQAAQELHLPRLVSYRSPTTSQLLTLAWSAAGNARIDRTWGRYWLMSQMRVRALNYDERRLTLSVPAGMPLPTLHLRALTLCSGIPAAVEIDPEAERQTRLSFRNVPAAIARLVLEKLGQS